MPRGRPKKKPAFKEPEYKEPEFKNVTGVGSTDEEDDGYRPEPPEEVIKVEFKGFDDTLERRRIFWDGENWEVLVMPRKLLMSKFMDRRGMLSLPSVLRSEWFEKTLKRNGFTSQWRFKKDDSGRIILPIPDEEAYGVWQKVL